MRPDEERELFSETNGKTGCWIMCQRLPAADEASLINRSALAKTDDF